MKLWILKPINPYHHPWLGYDRYHGFVIRAVDEAAARSIANDTGGEENEKPNLRPWLMPELSTCKELTGDGEQEIVLSDFAGS